MKPLVTARALVAGLFLVALSATAFADNWPSWRGPTGDGISKEASLPTEWSAEKNIAWTVKLPGMGGSTPIIWGDHIFLSSEDSKDFVLLCLGTDGKERWRINLPEKLEAEVNPIGGGPKKLGWGFTASPLVEGNLLLCLPGGPRGTVAALDKRTGKIVWRSTELTEQAAYTSPVVAEIDKVRQVLVLTNQGLRGVATANGKLPSASASASASESMGY